MSSDIYRSKIKNILMRVLNKKLLKDNNFYGVFIGNEDLEARKKVSYKKRKHYFENKKNFPKRKNKI